MQQQFFKANPANFSDNFKIMGKKSVLGHFLVICFKQLQKKSSLRKNLDKFSLIELPQFADQPPPASARDFGLWRPGKKRLPQRIRQEVGPPVNPVWI